MPGKCANLSLSLAPHREDLLQKLEGAFALRVSKLSCYSKSDVRAFPNVKPQPYMTCINRKAYILSDFLVKSLRLKFNTVYVLPLASPLTFCFDGISTSKFSHAQSFCFISTCGFRIFQLTFAYIHENTSTHAETQIRAYTKIQTKNLCSLSFPAYIPGNNNQALFVKSLKCLTRVLTNSFL